jgi:hypothetical protein
MLFVKYQEKVAHRFLPEIAYGRNQFSKYQFFSVAALLGQMSERLQVVQMVPCASGSRLESFDAPVVYSSLNRNTVGIIYNESRIIFLIDPPVPPVNIVDYPMLENKITL